MSKKCSNFLKKINEYMRGVIKILHCYNKEIYKYIFTYSGQIDSIKLLLLFFFLAVPLIRYSQEKEEERLHF